MKKYVLTTAVALGALLSLPVQAAPLASGASTLQGQAGHEAQQVYHCRSYSEGWNCGWGDLREQHSRYWSHRRSGSYGGGGGGGGEYRERHYEGGGSASEYEGFGHLRLWSHRRNGSSYGDGDGEGHSRYMSHQRYQSWKKAF
jgi:hypothetical protein